MDTLPNQNHLAIHGTQNGSQKPSVVPETQNKLISNNLPKNQAVKFSEPVHESALPKKKGGFVITGVKDDGDESADDMDVSHASYSDMSYSRTTDADHDQGSTASEDTATAILQLESSMTNQIQAKTAVAEVVAAATDQVVKPKLDPSATTKQQNMNPQQAQFEKQSHPVQPLESRQPLQKQAVAVSNASTTTTGSLHSQSSKTSNVSAPASVHQQEKQQPVVKEKNLRNYKFVKKDTSYNSLPISRKKGRWDCFEYLDFHLPSLPGVAHSSSFVKVGQKNIDKAAINNQPAPVNQIVASSSSYTLPHSDSSSSLQQRDPTQSVPSLHTSTVQHQQQHNMQQNINQPQMQMQQQQPPMQHSIHPANIQHSVQHSASSSSVNFPANSEPPNNFSYFNNSGYLPPSTNPLAFHNAGLNQQRMTFNPNNPEYSNDANPPPTPSTISSTTPMNSLPSNSFEFFAQESDKNEKEAQRTVRIENRIEQAMDLVKHHLTASVRYEMAELVNKNNYLQEKNWKLQIELEVVKGMIPPETMSTVYPVKYKEFMQEKMKKSSQHQQANQQQQPSTSSQQQIHQNQQQQQPAPFQQRQQQQQPSNLQANQPQQKQAPVIQQNVQQHHQVNANASSNSLMMGGSSQKLNLQMTQASATRGQQTAANNMQMMQQQQFVQQHQNPNNYTQTSNMQFNTQFHHQYISSHPPNTFYPQQPPFNNLQHKFSNQQQPQMTSANQQTMFTQAAHQQPAYFPNPPITTVASGGDVIQPNQQQVGVNPPQQPGFHGNNMFQAPHQMLYGGGGSNASINTMVASGNVAPAEGNQVTRNNNNLNKNS